MFLQDNEFGMFDWNASTWRGTGRLLNDNTWHHVACTFQSGVTNGTLCYIDGALATTTTMTIGNQLNGIAIGSGSTGGTQLFTGYIDDPRVYNRVLSAAEIAQLAGTSKIKVLAPTRGSLVGYWNLNDGIGTTARDTSGSGANGTFNGTPLWTTAKVGNSALTFNGTSQSVNTISSAALPTGTNPISVFAWIKTSTTSRETAFSYGSSATGQAVTLDVSQIGGNGHFWCYGQ
jgi:hypothetical protein